LLVAEVYREFALGGAGQGATENDPALKALLDEFAARADAALSVSLKQLLASQTTPIR
jgi:hypothetical protein